MSQGAIRIRPTACSEALRILTSELTDDGGPSQRRRSGSSLMARSVVALAAFCHGATLHRWFAPPASSETTPRVLSMCELGLSKGHSMCENGDGPVMSKMASYDPVSLFLHEQALAGWYSLSDHHLGEYESASDFQRHVRALRAYAAHGACLAITDASSESGPYPDPGTPLPTPPTSATPKHARIAYRVRQSKTALSSSATNGARPSLERRRNLQRRWEPNTRGWEYAEMRRPLKPVDQLEHVWLDFYSGMCPFAKWHGVHAQAGMIPPLDAYYAFEKDPVVRQIAMHMNPPTDTFPGITWVDDVSMFSESWLAQLRPGVIKGCCFAAPCVDFSKLRLLKNFKGEIPDPATARPGLNGPNGSLTRLSIRHLRMIREAGHDPILIAENVPFPDLEDQWAEVNAGWGVDAWTHNSSNNAKTWRHRAWWLYPPIRSEIASSFGPLDVNTALEPGHHLDPDSCATVTRSWTRGTEERPEQGSERKMLIVSDETGASRPPTVWEVERMMDYGTDSTAAPGLSFRQRLQALGNAWCYRTLHMIACSAFGLSPDQSRVFDPGSAAYVPQQSSAGTPCQVNVSSRSHVYYTSAQCSHRMMQGHEPDALDAQGAAFHMLLEHSNVNLLPEILDGHTGPDQELLVANYAAYFTRILPKAKEALLAFSNFATTDDEDSSVNVSCLDTGSEGTFDPGVVVTRPDLLSAVHGWTGDPVTTEGAGYLPMSMWDVESKEWFDYDLDGEKTPIEAGLDSLLGWCDLRKHWRCALGAEGEDNFACSIEPIQGKYRRVRLGQDTGGKLTLEWKLRVGEREAKVSSTSKSSDDYDHAAVRFANVTLMLHRVLEDICEWDSSSPDKKLTYQTSHSIRAAMKEHEPWLTLLYAHKALGHISPTRLRWTLKRAHGTLDPGHIEKIPCAGCELHKAKRPALSQKPIAEKRRNAELQGQRTAALQEANDREADHENQAIQGPATRDAIALQVPREVELQSDDEGFDSDMEEAEALSRKEGHDSDDEDGISNEDLAPTRLDQAELELLEQQLDQEQPEAIPLGELEFLKRAHELVDLEATPTMPRFEDSRPMEHTFVDFKPYAKNDTIYGSPIGEIMFADHRTVTRDVETVPRNKRRDVYNAVKRLLLRHRIPHINKHEYACTVWADGCGSNKKWVERACLKLGVNFRLTPAWAQELNEAEKVANVVWSNARALLEDAGLHDTKLLPFAIRFICQRHFISATNHERKWMSPYELLYGIPPTIRIRDLPAFYTRCYVPSTKERRQQLMSAASKKGETWKHQRAEAGRYLCNESLYSRLPRAILDRTRAVVGSKAMKYRFGDDVNYDINTAPQEITHETLHSVGLPASIIQIVPEVVSLGPDMKVEPSDNADGDEIGPTPYYPEDRHTTHERDDESAQLEVSQSPEPASSAHPSPGGYVSSTSPTPSPARVKKHDNPLASIMQEMESNAPHVHVQIEELRDHDEVCNPKNHNFETFSYADPEARFRTGANTSEGAEPLPARTAGKFQGSYALHTSKEGYDSKHIKVFHVVSDYIDMIPDPFERAQLEASLDAWYHERLHVDDAPRQSKRIKHCNVTEIRRAHLAAAKAQNDMDWKKVIMGDKTFLKQAVIARDKEITSLCENILTPLSEQSGDWSIAIKTATNCRLLLSVKRDGTVKCRLVKQGFRENLLLTDGPDFNYSSNVVKLHTVRMALAQRRMGNGKTRRRIAVKDISTAFLQSHSYPDGKVKYCKYRDPIDGKVVYFRQTGPIYGEAAAPMLWEETVAPWIESLGFERGENERSVFYSAQRDLLVLLYVDDCLVDGDEEDIKWFFDELNERFECKDPDWLSEDEPLDYLGMEVSIDDEYIRIGMPKYITKMVEHLQSMGDGFTVLPQSKCHTPISEAVNEDGMSKLLNDTRRKIFQTALGMTGWLTQTARPDIALAQSRIAQHAASPSESAMKAIHHLVSYLWHTRDLHIRARLHSDDEFSMTLSPDDTGWSFFSDTDHAGNREVNNRRRSQNSRFVFYHGMPVDWKSSVSSIAFANEDIGEAHADMSSGAAEIYGAANATLDGLHLKYVAEEMNLEFPRPIRLQVDNTTVEAFHRGTVQRSKLKHIDCRQEWVKTLRDKDLVKVVHVDTALNVADIGTKILDRLTFERLRDMFMFEYHG